MLPSDRRAWHRRNRVLMAADAPGNSGEDELALHPAVKPVALVADAILDCSRRRGLVLDCVAASGTTLLAAERTGRVGYGIELDPSMSTSRLRASTR